MATLYVSMRGATLVFGPDLVAVTPPFTTGQDVSCQITEARVDSDPVTTTDAATLCQDETDNITGLKDTLFLSAFQDWSDPGGLAWYLRTNALDVVFFGLALPDSGSYTGEVTLAPLQYGGAAGANLVGQVTLPVLGLVTTPPAALLAATKRAAKQTAAA